MAGPPDDPYARLEYRRLIAWPERIRREEPFLRLVLENGPNSRVLDLGCGTGEHALFLASLGFEVTGVDRSAAQIEEARRSGEGRTPFVEGDLVEIGALVGEGFGGAICLGNTLPHLSNSEELHRFLSGLASRLVSGAPFLVQVLNYDRIFSNGILALPPNVRGEAGERLVFLRLMEPREDGTVVFNPTTLRWRADQEPSVEVAASRRVLLRGYRRAELEVALTVAGFRVETIFGGMAQEGWSAGESLDTVVVARRA